MTDKRSLIGKRHELALVVLGFLTAILRSSGKLSISKIHRMMLRDYPQLCSDVGYTGSPCISRVQLCRILAWFDYEQYNSINMLYFNKHVAKQSLQWYALDGKELRGSIDKANGAKRGENVVTKVSHGDRASEIIGFYNGDKESEKTIVTQYIDSRAQIPNEGYSVDALHISSCLLSKIERKSGIYLAQVKDNQKHLCEELNHTISTLPIIERCESLEKGHGRVEKREGMFYDLNVESLDSRWKESGLTTLCMIKRSCYQTKTGKTSQETALYVSNLNVKNSKDAQMLFGAVRNHWRVEVNNYIRDTNFGEDQIRTTKAHLIRSVASFINLSMNMLQSNNPQANLNVVRENCHFQRDAIIPFFKKY